QLFLGCAPCFDYGRLPGEWKYTGAGYHEARATSQEGDVYLDLNTDLNIGFEGPRATARTRIKGGETRWVALSWSEHPAPKNYEDAYDRLVWTAHHWQHWLDHGEFPHPPRGAPPPRSPLTL